jgi:hypothetical protein
MAEHPSQAAHAAWVGTALLSSTAYALFLLYMVAVIPCPIFVIIPAFAIHHHTYFLVRLSVLQRVFFADGADVWLERPTLHNGIERCVLPFGAAILCGLAAALEVLCLSYNVNDDFAGTFIVQAVSLFYVPHVAFLGVVAYVTFACARGSWEMNIDEEKLTVLFEKVRQKHPFVVSLTADGSICRMSCSTSLWPRPVDAMRRTSLLLSTFTPRKCIHDHCILSHVSSRPQKSLAGS